MPRRTGFQAETSISKISQKIKRAKFHIAAKPYGLERKSMKAIFLESVEINDEHAHLLYEYVETDRYFLDLVFGLRIGKLKDYHRELYLTPNGNYVMAYYYEGDKPYYEVLSKEEAAEFVRDRNKERYIELFKPREL